MWVIKSRPPTPVCKEWGTTCPGNDENLGNPVPFVGWTQPRVCGELLVGLSLSGSRLFLRHWASICAVTLGSWERGGG